MGDGHGTIQFIKNILLDGQGTVIFIFFKKKRLFASHVGICFN